MEFSFESNHAEVSECIHNSLLLFGRTDRSLAVFRLGLVIALAHFQAALLLDLGNVEGGHLQSGVLQNVFFNLRIGRVIDDGSHIKLFQ